MQMHEKLYFLLLSLILLHCFVFLLPLLPLLANHPQTAIFQETPGLELQEAAMRAVAFLPLTAVLHVSLLLLFRQLPWHEALLHENVDRIVPDCVGAQEQNKPRDNSPIPHKRNVQEFSLCLVLSCGETNSNSFSHIC